METSFGHCFKCSTNAVTSETGDRQVRTNSSSGRLFFYYQLKGKRARNMEVLAVLQCGLSVLLCPGRALEEAVGQQINRSSKSLVVLKK